MARAPNRSELGLAAAILALALAPRLWMAVVFPTQPISDFAALHAFALALRDESLVAPGWFWAYLNPGVPLLLLPVFALFPDATVEAARITTAVATAFVALLPWLLWRDVYPTRVRLVAALGLALWPGQILFSGVVAQDNWVLLPAVALAALAARGAAQRGAAGAPVATGLLYGAATAIRQEMVLVLLPLLLPAAGLWGAGPERAKRLARLAFAALAVLTPLAMQRWAATGRLAITTEHGGLAVLGTFVPGASINGWIDPLPHVAAVAPSLLEDSARLRRSSVRLALNEMVHRPRFHAERILASTLQLLRNGTAVGLYWSVGSPEVLPPEARARGVRLSHRMSPFLLAEMLLIQGLFVAALAAHGSKLPAAVAWLVAAILLKVGVHALGGAQGRYLLPVFAWQILAIALATTRLPASRLRLAASLILGATASATLWVGAPPLMARVYASDPVAQRRFRFPIFSEDGQARLDCSMTEGRLIALTATSATIAPFKKDPAPGERAAAVCRSASGGAPVSLRIADRYPHGGMPDRMEQRVEIDGTTVWRHDIAAEPGADWATIPLPSSGPAEIAVVVAAVRPDRGPAWGNAAQTEFQIEVPSAR